MPPASNLKVTDSRHNLGFQYRNCYLVSCITYYSYILFLYILYYNYSAPHKKDTNTNNSNGVMYITSRSVEFRKPGNGGGNY